jgi:hypothetical protein
LALKFGAKFWRLNLALKFGAKIWRQNFGAKIFVATKKNKTNKNHFESGLSIIKKRKQSVTKLFK